MKQFCTFLSLFLSVALATAAQEATNVRAQQEGEQIIITYDLDKTANVRVYVETGQSNQYTELKAVTGNVGKGVRPGTNRRITWMPLEERSEFVAQNVRFKVEAKSTMYYFSVSPTKKVAFSPGNLQYHPSTHTWRFAPYQWEYIGEANKNISKTYDGWIDLFGWGTGNDPIKLNKNDEDYKTFMDWGNNKIGNDVPDTWRTLTDDEWQYLFRNTRWTMTRVNGVLGFMLLPDEFTAPVGMTIAIVSDGKMSDSYKYFEESDYASNQYTAKEFTPLEAKGCVFLPCAGYRSGSGVYDVGYYGDYWSATPSALSIAGDLRFYSTIAYSDLWYYRSLGLSVRLVQDLK